MEYKILNGKQIHVDAFGGYFIQYKRGRSFGIIKECDLCGKEMFAQNSNIGMGGGKYCSNSCTGKSRARKPVKVYTINGKEISELENGQVFTWMNDKQVYGKILTCQLCGKDMFVPNINMYKRYGNYCSQKCRGIARSKGY